MPNLKTIVLTAEEAERFAVGAYTSGTPGFLTITRRVEPQPEHRGTAGTWWDNRVYSGTEWPHAISGILADDGATNGRMGELVQLRRLQEYGDEAPHTMKCKCGRWADPKGDDHGCVWTGYINVAHARIVGRRVERRSVNVTEYAPDGIDPPEWVVVTELEIVDDG